MAKTKADLFSTLKQNVLNTDPATPKQKIVPIKVKEDEEPFTLWMNSARLQNLRMKAAGLKGESIKSLINQAVLEKYPEIDQK